MTALAVGAGFWGALRADDGSLGRSFALHAGVTGAVVIGTFWIGRAASSPRLGKRSRIPFLLCVWMLWIALIFVIVQVVYSVTATAVLRENSSVTTKRR
jgi:hypothetical protein